MRLVVVAPHPDDEILACAGLLVMHQAQGGEIVVLSVTDGEASHVSSGYWQASELAEVRHLELVAGLNQLGLYGMTIVRLSLPDGAIQQHCASLEQAMTHMLRPADVVITTWRLDGHPDHEATAATASKACMSKGCRLVEAPVWMWHWAKLDDPLVPWHRLFSVPLNAQTVDLKKLALAAHLSQLDPLSRPGGAVLDAAIVARAGWDHEYFFL